MRLVSMVLIALVVGLAFASEPDAVVGRWASESSVLDITETDGQLHAVVVAIRDAVYREGESGAVGEVRRDDRNPDDTLRARPVVGIDLLTDYRLERGRWKGRIYDPESGKTYSSQMKVNDGKLEMRGYVGTPMLGRTVVFDPVKSCLPHIVAMLALAALDDCG